MLPKLYRLLSLVDHQSAPLEAARHGGSPSAYTRYLNADGRWAIHGSAHAPLLVWEVSDATTAQAAAETASKARGRPVEVTTRADSSWEEGRQIKLFAASNGPALLGHTPQSEAKARRLRTEVEKLEAFCSVVAAAAAAKDQAAFVEVSRAAASALRVKFGGGSVSSCSAWLAGSKGRSTLDSLLAGEAELAGNLSLEQVVQIVELARKADKLAT